MPNTLFTAGRAIVRPAFIITDKMKKTYTSTSEVHLSLQLAEGQRRRVSFRPKSGGGSTYSTSDPAEQNALERHHYFNRVFTLSVVSGEGRQPVGRLASSPKPSGSVAKAGGTVSSAEENGSKLQAVKVSCADDAKDYLADKFGLSRTKLRSKSAILAAAKEHGIEFVGI